MSKVTERSLVWYPPAFPARGRLPTEAGLVGASCKKQDSHELQYRQELCIQAGRSVEPPCCKTLHISLFFDGTGNNLNNDLYLSKIKHPTNIARLFQATIGSGYAGGVKTPDGLFDRGVDKFFKFYLPGVGTPFPEINDLDYTMGGLAFANKGEDRINWALLRIIDVLKRAIGKPGSDSQTLSVGESRTAIDNMAASWAKLGFGGSHNRYEEFSRQLRLLKDQLKPALEQPEPGKPKLLGIKLYVYGFSRGAATARTFVRWLSELLPPPEKGNDKPEQCLEVDGLKIPLSVEFLGLLDTVASVGTTHMLPFVDGHASWADETMELPAEETFEGFIKRCVHMVSAHEQRLCFPLDSIRRANGRYPSDSEEIIYPGVHSDVGGGYPPGDQGKASANDDSYVLSQIILNDMFAAAFKAGAPLKVEIEALPDMLKKDQWRIMTFQLSEQFDVAPEMIKRFNAWRKLTLNLSTPGKIEDADAANYVPALAPVCLEVAIEEQMSWITGWRINRYAKGKLINLPFYKDATDTQSMPLVRESAKVEQELAQGAARARRKKEMEGMSEAQLKDHIQEPGPKDFDPDMGQTQLKEAAQEFAEDYRGVLRSQTSLLQTIADVGLQQTVFLLNTDDEPAEYRKMKTKGEQKEELLFPYVDEARDINEKSGLVRALFDDQIHDSRAWFMHAFLGSREPWGSYFRYRMIYFGKKCNKSLSPLIIAGNVVGVATLAGGVIFSLKRKSVLEKVAGIAGTVTLVSFELEALDLLTKAPLPLLPHAAELKQFTQEPGEVVQQQKAAAADQYFAKVKSIINSDLLETVQSKLA